MSNTTANDEYDRMLVDVHEPELMVRVTMAEARALVTVLEDREEEHGGDYARDTLERLYDELAQWVDMEGEK